MQQAIERETALFAQRQRARQRQAAQIAIDRRFFDIHAVGLPRHLAAGMEALELQRVALQQGRAQRKTFEIQIGLHAVLAARAASPPAEPHEARMLDDHCPARLVPGEKRAASGRNMASGICSALNVTSPVPEAIFTPALSLPGRRASGSSAEMLTLIGPSVPSSMSKPRPSRSIRQAKPVRSSVTEILASTIFTADRDLHGR